MNFDFFYACIKVRNMMDFIILAFCVTDNWVERLNEFRHEVVTYFTNRFQEPFPSIPLLKEVMFHSFTLNNNFPYTGPFLLYELDHVISHSGRNKSPEPDNFNFSFIKNYWYLLRTELRVMIE